MHAASLPRVGPCTILPETANGLSASAQTPASFSGDLQLLDDPLAWSAFSRTAPGAPARVESSVVIEGMSCAACALAIEDALKAMPGVLRADVSAGSHRATVVWAPDIVLPSQWMHAIRRAGYLPFPANDRQAVDQRRVEARRALWRWLVAGLCMMQVMMYAYPAYVALPGDLSGEMERLLRWASWVLTLPVMLFSCGPFFRSALRDLAQRRVSMDLPVALGLLITFVVSTAGTFDPQGVFGREVFFDSLTMFVFFLLTGRWLELRLRDRTAGALEAMMNRLPTVVQRRRPDGDFEPVLPQRLVPGDVLRVLPGEAFAADGVVTLGDTLVDQSLLTGESSPVARGVGSAVVAGSHNLSASVQFRVERTGADTRFAQIVALMQSAATAKPRLALLADRVARPFLLAVLLAAVGACAYWWPIDPARALMVAVAVLIVTCPCALSLATPAAMLASAGSLARAGVLVRRLQGLEALAAVDTVVFDKTGTLTTDRMRIGAITTRPGLTTDDALALAGALAQHSLHPVSRALVLAARQAGPGLARTAIDVAEVVGKGVQGRLVSGAGEPPGGLLRLGSAGFCGGTPQQSGLGQTLLCDDDGWLATFEVCQDVRPDARAAVATLQAHGIRVHMLSGDDADATRRVAAQVGIEAVRSGCTPYEKLALLSAQQRLGHRVAMVGDGLNDAPVLAGADVSFAFGQAVPLAQSQADFVVLGAQLERVVQTLLLARRTMRVVRQNLSWALAYNLACVPLAVVGWLPAWLAGLGMAASSLVVVLNALRLSRDMPSGAPA